MNRTTELVTRPGSKFVLGMLMLGVLAIVMGTLGLAMEMHSWRNVIIAFCLVIAALTVGLAFGVIATKEGFIK